jgi:hypothetical protein
MALTKPIIEQIRKFLEEIQQPDASAKIKRDFHQRFYLAQLLFTGYELTPERKRELTDILNEGKKGQHLFTKDIDDLINFFSIKTDQPAEILDAIKEINRFLLDQLLSNQPDSYRQKQNELVLKNRALESQLPILEKSYQELKLSIEPEENKIRELTEKKIELEEKIRVLKARKEEYDELKAKKENFEQLNAFVTDPKITQQINEWKQSVHPTQYNKFLANLKTLKLLQETLSTLPQSKEKNFISVFAELTQANPILMGMLPSVDKSTQDKINQLHEESTKVLISLNTFFKDIIEN